MTNELTNTHLSLFEEIKQTDETGNEFWSARELSKVLEYAEYRNFKPVIEKAKDACKNSDQEIQNHFVEFHEMVKIGSGAERGFDDGVKLSRYACYLIVQNADRKKEKIMKSSNLKNHGSDTIATNLLKIRING
ncbi:BRO N-terminal domain containing protein [Spirosomataceae bacterium]|jgi:DNA-damage-inducible protein D